MEAAFKKDKLHWYKDAIIYELHIKAFRDGNGDGIGDFEGLLQTLDYLQDIGVTAIWLLPFYPSPLKDDGYDIADYYHIHPAYGNIDQFRELLKEAHQRNLKVITELVINHTSDQHPWFQIARRAPKGSPERNYYVWSDDPGKYKDVRIIFQDFEPSNWSWDAVAEQYYWHRFFHHQPDLNFDNLQVQEEILNIISYWCNMGVDGFRLDAIPYLFEREGTNGENLPETHSFLKKLRKHVDEHFPGTVFLAEANMWPEDAAAYFGKGDECHMNFHFPLMPRMFMALQMEDRYPITDIFDQTPAIPESCQWAIFLRNHDELTLEMVTDEERDYMYTVYAEDPKARINLGIRHRLAPLMKNNRHKIELLNCLLFSLPGTPVIYYGDEIGMGDNFYLGDRDGVRTPMQWSRDRNAGFSKANPQQLYLPLILDPEYHYESLNAESQRLNTSSLFWFMKRIISMRKRYKAFGRGNFQVLNLENPKVFAFTRTYEEQTLLVLVNLSKFPQPAELDLGDYKGYQVIEVVSRNKFPKVKDDGLYFFTLASYAFHWFSLEKMHDESSRSDELPVLEIADWPAIQDIDSQTRLESELLPAYLPRSKWFNALHKAFFSVRIGKQELVKLGPHQILILFLDTVYQSGLPEIYHLPVCFVPEEEAVKLKSTYPDAFICRLQCGGNRGFLCDALFIESVQQNLFLYMMSQQSVALRMGKMDFYGDRRLREHRGESNEVKSRLHTSDELNTSITYDNRFFLRMYRKIDLSLNPDLEITRFLTEKTKFRHMPQFIGAIEWKYDGQAVVLGMMQTMIENHGDGYGYMRERVDNFIERVMAANKSKLNPFEFIGSLTRPVGFEQLPEHIQELIGTNAANQTRLLGRRTGQMHLALASGVEEAFRPEAFSLHYQRSLYSHMQSLLRQAVQHLSRYQKKAGGEPAKKAELILGCRTTLMDEMKKIYSKKLDMLKIRIHGNLRLSQVLLTGKDIAIQGYGGNPAFSYSERRLKRSPLRDIASMVSSIYEVAHETFHGNDHVTKESKNELMPFSPYWAHYISCIFIHSWIETVGDSELIPKDSEACGMIIQNYLLLEILGKLNNDISYHEEKVPISFNIILALLKQEGNLQAAAGVSRI
ncbi:MAG TPA: maltose alpha-D-glucosyltransferase [Puia sp.]|nr:maltose alpha-D-glucosyltransferase [Puia sp.]